MDTIFRTIGAVCLFAYLFSIVVDTVNLKTNKKIVQLVAILYIISIIVSPVYSFELDTDTIFEESEIYNYSQLGNNHFKEQLENEIENKISSQLNSKNIHFENIEVHIYCNENEIAVDQIYILGVDSKDKDAVKSLLMEYTSENNIILGD